MTEFDVTPLHTDVADFNEGVAREAIDRGDGDVRDKLGVVEGVCLDGFHGGRF